MNLCSLPYLNQKSSLLRVSHKPHLEIGGLFQIFIHLYNPTMRCPDCLFPILVTLAHANTFKVFYNTFDPAVFGTTGGAHLNATGDGYVDALSICIRFQVHYSSLSMTYCQFLQVIFIHFQFANLAGNDDKWRWRSVVYRIYDVKTNRKLLEATAGMYISLFLFGYPVAKNTYSGYILDDDGE